MTIQQLLDSPCTSYWLKDAIRTALNRDAVDALYDAKALVEVLQNRLNNLPR